MSGYNEKQKEYTMKYMKNNLDEIKFRVPKGKKAEYRKAAENRGKKLTPFIIEAIEEKIEHDPEIEPSSSINDNEKLTFTNNTES
ncbi:MAG TPA: hypothetical protein IAC96_09075 [Candidatus Fimimorpha faecalis]|uniref:Arc-like DNA binding domain-containing protein n=1 Tax=Candidatus Fimimorpha faecalis TaxID=2840824 RepID=A0A9D1JDH4_9FIRM|nr:hypothetical protein [Candidatus Fimimorpha faecalis]